MQTNNAKTIFRECVPKYFALMPLYVGNNFNHTKLFPEAAKFNKKVIHVSTEGALSP